MESITIIISPVEHGGFTVSCSDPDLYYPTTNVDRTYAIHAAVDMVQLILNDKPASIINILDSKVPNPKEYNPTSICQCTCGCQKPVLLPDTSSCPCCDVGIHYRDDE